MNLLEKYELDLQQDDFIKDECQISAIHYLMDLSSSLVSSNVQKNQPRHFWQSIFAQPRENVMQGLYLYGDVGRGKTYLMDLFFDNLEINSKMRLHFHHFMHTVHKEMNLFAGQKNPLILIAKKLSKQTQVICFDEFFVEDITDAMILAGIFKALFDQGVVLVATSNTPPEDLYKKGLQRARFIPTIALLRKYCHIFNLDNGKDYRLDSIAQTEIYHFPLDDGAHLQIQGAFERLAKGHKQYNKIIEINQRSLKTKALSNDVLYMTFLALCDSPRSVNDYIEIAILYRTVLIDNVMQMDDLKNDLARRFIAMIDEFYDKHVVVIISAEVSIKALYVGDKLSFTFKRCVSRLFEMQSHAYLSKSHNFKV
ncbi:MAG: AFG1 family ATPase [Psychromonas sp.]|nr:AFG1 family ATPase [Psychromonas sp.]